MPARSADTVRFVLDGEIVEALGVSPTTTLLQYLREELGRTGTKEGCAEGDCGACTVVLGEPREGKDAPIEYRAVNSCIRFLPTVDGKAVITVESLKSAAGLHPVQRAMVDCHASQCGFCTPGFVMSLFGLYLAHPRPARCAIVSALSGNLCRCTGYRPIIEAGSRMDDYPEPELWSRADAQSPRRRALLESIRRSGMLELTAEPGYAAPRTLDELARRYESAPRALLLAGGTDVGLSVTKELRDLPPLIHIGEVAELRRIREIADVLEIGAAVSLADAWAALVARYPALEDFADRFASPPIRHSGTLCGNLANGSPIGDSMPVLIVLDATVMLRHGARTRELPLDELYLGYRKTALAPGEFIAAVRVPQPRPGRVSVAYKVAKRHDQDTSAVCGAYTVELNGRTVTAARICYGGMAAIPQRARRAEAALTGRPWSAEAIAAAADALAEDYRPISDMRASTSYRLEVAGNLLKRLYLEHGGAGVPGRSGVFGNVAGAVA